MARVKRGNVLQQRHKKILKFAKGFRGSKHTLFIAANQAVIQAWRNAYRDRRKRKRDFRSLWITRINAACRAHGIPYSRFMHGLSRTSGPFLWKELRDPLDGGATSKEEVHRTSPQLGRLPASSAGWLRVLTRRM
jgi:large subunit ribosomal protein L20